MATEIGNSGLEGRADISHIGESSFQLTERLLEELAAKEGQTVVMSGEARRFFFEDTTREQMAAGLDARYIKDWENTPGSQAYAGAMEIILADARIGVVARIDDTGRLPILIPETI